MEAKIEEAQLERAATALRENNIAAVIVDTGAEAAKRILEEIPDGAEVHSGKSKTLEDIGVHQALHESGKYDSVRARYLKMDRQTQAREIRKLTAAPDYLVGSAAALTEKGEIVSVSYTGSQLGSLLHGAGRVLLVVGSQKIVPDLDAAWKRIDEVAFPYEDDRLMAQLGAHTREAKVAILVAEARPGRTVVYLVREPVGV